MVILLFACDKQQAWLFLQSKKAVHGLLLLRMCVCVVSHGYSVNIAPAHKLGTVILLSCGMVTAWATCRLGYCASKRMCGGMLLLI